MCIAAPRVLAVVADVAGVRAANVDHLGRVPTRAELTAARRAAHSLAALGCASVLRVPGDDNDGNADDRTYLVLAKPNVIMTTSDSEGWLLGECRRRVGREIGCPPRSVPCLCTRRASPAQAVTRSGSILLKYLTDGYTGSLPGVGSLSRPQLGAQTAGL
jgi:hypothetical protein